MKYQPQFPQRIGCIQDAKAFCRSFLDWYNQQHHHTGVGLMTIKSITVRPTKSTPRARTLSMTPLADPERFVRKEPQPPARPTATWINPPLKFQTGLSHNR
jgi:hypothetical protein